MFKHQIPPEIFLKLQQKYYKITKNKENVREDGSQGEMSENFLFFYFGR